MFYVRLGERQENTTGRTLGKPNLTLIFFLLRMTIVIILLAFTCHLTESIKCFNRIKLHEQNCFFWHTLRTLKLILIPHKVICNLSQPHRLILYLSLKIVSQIIKKIVDV
jgi:hypothetical protein